MLPRLIANRAINEACPVKEQDGIPEPMVTTSDWHTDLLNINSTNAKPGEPCLLPSFRACFWCVFQNPVDRSQAAIPHLPQCPSTPPKPALLRGLLQPGALLVLILANSGGWMALAAT
jgi:hypothetical protein